MSVRRHHLVVPLLAALLGACASTPPQASVQVFTAPQPVGAETTYRFERLPSQAAHPLQPEMEAIADAALARAGLRRDGPAARLVVQLSAGQDRPAPGWGWGGPNVGIGIGGGSGGAGVGVGLNFPLGGAVRATNRVDVQVRELASGRIVFQSQAAASAAVHPAALVQAALTDFPNMPTGRWQVPLAPPPVR